MAISFIDLYKLFFSPFLNSVLGTRCRFSPTCSCYAREAFKQNGFTFGLCQTIKRVCRCHPWGGKGYDPVQDVQPEKRINRGA